MTENSSAKSKNKRETYMVLVAIAAALIVLVAVLSISRSNRGNKSETSISPNADWLAVVYKDTISVEEFTMRYEEAMVRKSDQNSREIFLRSLLIERLLAEYSDENRLDTIPELRAQIQQLQDEAAIEGLLYKEVDRRVNATDAELRQEFPKALRDLVLNAWMCRDSARAEKIYGNIQKGASFFDAGANLGGAQQLLKERPLSYGDADVRFENIAYSLDKGQISAPFYHQGSWWVLELVDQKIKGRPSDRLFKEMLPAIRNIFLNRERGIVQEEFILNLMRGTDLKIEKPAYSWLVQHLKKQLLENTEPAKPGTKPTFKVKHPSQLPSTVNQKDLSQSLLVFTRNEIQHIWTVKDVLERMSVMSKQIPDPRSRSFEQDLYSGLIWLIEFASLAEFAEQEGITYSRAVQNEEKMWTDHLKATQGWRHFLESVPHPFAASSMPQKESPVPGVSATRLDSVFSSWLTEQEKLSGLKLRLNRLYQLELSERVAVYRKAHFPNRVASPIPVGYSWAEKWVPQAGAIKE